MKYAKQPSFDAAADGWLGFELCIKLILSTIDI